MILPDKARLFHDCLALLEQKADMDKGVLAFLRSTGPKCLFGAGQQAKNCLYLFQGLFGLSIEALLVSNPEQPDCNGIPLLGFSTAPDKAVPVLVAIEEQASLAIRATLEQTGFSAVHVCANWERTNFLIKESFFRAALAALNVDSAKNWLNLNGVRLLNPLGQPEAYAQLLYGTAFTNIILPEAWGERHFISGGEYCPTGREIRQGDIVLDVGASAGLFTLFAAHKAGRVLAVEPSRSAWPWLLHNTNALPNVECSDLALADTPESLPFFDRRDYAKYSGLVPQEGSNWASYDVACDTVDGLMASRALVPDVIKISANGAEVRILAGAKNTLRCHVPRLLVTTDDSDGCASFLKKMRLPYALRRNGQMLFAEKCT
ncbi:FkbM family methyltransferase [Desulfovibrio sp. OttesenSCG-928-M14]|nr:FkbM family methyltransferase [Desulfovibrio sp. OttesenSCG-928-M14]